MKKKKKLDSCNWTVTPAISADGNDWCVVVQKIEYVH